MKAKEKAKELMDKMNNRPIKNDEWNTASDFAKNNLKRKVLIAVDEILNEYPYQCPKYSYEMERHLFWQEVRIEIEKM
jgi:IS30 family transposase